MPIYHQEALPLELYQNTVSITTYNISTNEQKTYHGIMHYQLEAELIFGFSSLAENNQKQFSKF